MISAIAFIFATLHIRHVYPTNPMGQTVVEFDDGKFLTVNEQGSACVAR